MTEMISARVSNSSGVCRTHHALLSREYRERQACIEFIDLQSNADVARRFETYAERSHINPKKYGKKCALSFGSE